MPSACWVAHRAISSLFGHLKMAFIADFQVTEKMLQHFISRVHKNSFIRPSPRVLIWRTMQFQLKLSEKAIRESALSAGAREVRLIEEPMAAAIGAGLPVEEATGSMVVVLAAVPLKLLFYRSMASYIPIRCAPAGTVLMRRSSAFVRRNYGSLIGDSTAERIKEEIGTAVKGGELREIDVRGRNLAEGVPRSFTRTSDEVVDALQDSLGAIIQGVKGALEQAPPELASDIAESGIVLTGGGALLRGLDRLLADETACRSLWPKIR